VVITPDVRLSIPLAVILLFSVTAPASEIVRLSKVVAPVTDCPPVPLKVVVLVAGVNVPLFIQLPAMFIAGELEQV